MAELDRSGQNGIAECVVELEAIDPAARDGLYWTRFHREVMKRAGAELARRRQQVEVTIADALSGWARMVVPVAAVAAALAGVMLVQNTPAPPSQVVVDVLDVPSAVDEEPEPDFIPTLSATAVAENF